MSSQPFIAGSINDAEIAIKPNKSIPKKGHYVGNIDQLRNEEGYQVYYQIFRKIRLLIIILGLWAPPESGCFNFCLRYIYPILIYCIILYPWTTFITQAAYWSIPVFLFITLHISGWVSYLAARRYWKKDHFAHFITSTFIPYYDNIDQFERKYNISDTFGIDYDINDDNEEENNAGDNNTTSLKSGFLNRYAKDNKKRKVAAERKFHIHKLNEIDTSSLADIASSTNKLSMSLFYEGMQRLWYRFWILTGAVTMPIFVILLTEIIVPSLHSSIDSSHGGIHSQLFADMFVPFNTIIIFLRIFYVICNFVFMLFYFKFICECHRGDVLIHLHYFDTSDIIKKYNRNQMQYYKEMESRLAAIVWNWDRVISVTQKTSFAFRHWIFVTFVINFMAAVVAIVNLAIHLEQFPQHLEMYIPALVNVVISFYVMFVGAQIAHMNTTVDKRTYFLLATAHFAHVDVHINRDEHKINEDVDAMMLLQIRQQNLYSQAQAVAKTAKTMPLGIAVYGLVLHRNLFLAFFAPFITFLALCLNQWLPK